MAYINLLPWREEAKKAQKKEFFMILGAIALMALAITLLIGQFYQLRLNGQNDRNQFLQNEIKILDVKIGEIRHLNDKKKDLEKRISVVQQLQRSRNVGTQVLGEITHIVPNGVYLTSVVKESNMLELVGKSESNNHLANMIREIEDSGLLIDAQLNTITRKNTKSRLLSDFNMGVRTLIKFWV